MPRTQSLLALPAAKSSSCLTFAPMAWLKLQFFCHAGRTEIGGFGVSAEQDLLYVEDFVTVRQQVTPVTVRFEDEAVADFFDACVDRGLHVEQCSRLWMHTHPGASVVPSVTDEETFAHCFGRCDWSLMFILGRTGLTYARLAVAAGPGAEVLLPTTVDWTAWPDWVAAEAGLLEAEMARWREEYRQNICPFPDPCGPATALAAFGTPPGEPAGWWDSDPWNAELDEAVYEPVEEPLNHEPGKHNRAS